ncbi:hypothetical protein R3W88_024543 [Solanum pinnatisectum]|uniref:Uncharacterized protein n=1 Tax=Solanum pinnatisectum TaxID=50273 RepID=A0AAV9M3U6_9SOLN|nr:hypothetical protein R3W88_024543 [Solanum pinnatisectum]
MGNDKAQAHDEGKGTEEVEILIQQSIANGSQKDVEKSNPIPKMVQPLPKIPHPFPQRLKKKNEDEFKKFLSVFKTLSINLPLMDALLEMPEVSHSFKKKKDPGAFTIPCTIDMLQFSKSLCDLGATINLMLYAIYKQLGLGEPKSATMKLLMADRSIKHPVGILYDILVNVVRLIFPADFVILDYDIDARIPIILGRPFLATGRALVDVESAELKFRVNEDEVTFNDCKSMKHPSDIHEVSTIDVIDEAVASVSHLICMSEPLEVVLANYDEFEVQGYEEVVASLSGMGEYSKTPLKVDINLKN